MSAEYPANRKPNMFGEILQRVKQVHRAVQDELQLEVHFRSTQYSRQFTCIVNNMRLMGIFDWLLSVKTFIACDVIDERG